MPDFCLEIKFAKFQSGAVHLGYPPDNVWRVPPGITGQRPQGMLTHGVPSTLTNHTVKVMRCITVIQISVLRLRFQISVLRLMSKFRSRD